MRKGIIVVIAAVAMFAVVIPAGAETVFNETSKWIASWSKPCSEYSGSKRCESTSSKSESTAKTNIAPGNKASARAGKDAGK